MKKTPEPLVVVGAQLETFAETQERLKIGRTKVFELIRQGDIETVKFGARSTRIVADSVDRLIARERSGRGRGP